MLVQSWAVALQRSIVLEGNVHLQVSGEQQEKNDVVLECQPFVSPSSDFESSLCMGCLRWWDADPLYIPFQFWAHMF